MSIGRQAARGVAWYMLLGVSTRVLGLVGTLILQRFISPGDFGAVNAASIAVTTASAFTSFSFGQYLIAKRASPEVAAQAAVIHVALGLAATAVVYAARGAIGEVFNAPALGQYVLGYAVANLILDRVRYVPERILMRALRFRTLAMINGAGELVLTATALATFRWFGAYAIMLGAVGRSIVTSVLFLAAAPRAEWLVRARLRAADVRDLLGYGVPIMIAIVTDTATSKWDNGIVSRMFGATIMGGYNSAYNLADTPISNVAEHIGEVLMPSFSRMEAGQRERAAVRAASLMSLVVSPLGVGLGAIAPTAAAVFFNAQWRPIVAPMLTILSVMTVFRPMPWSVISYVQAVQRTRIVMISSFLRAILVLSLVAAGGVIGGPNGACVGAGIGFALHSVVTIIAAGHVTPLPAGEYLSAIGRSLLPCLPMFVAVFALARGLDRANAPLIVSLIAQIVTGAVIYVGAAFVLVRPSAEELLRLGREAISRRRG
jgi:PST family polysaccharide transporter